MHVSNDGDKRQWTNARYFAGTTLQNKAIQGIQILKIDTPVGYPLIWPSDIVISGHFGDIGDLAPATGNNFYGTRGQSRTMQKISFRVKGRLSKHYGISYTGHAGTVGDINKCHSNGQPLGFSGYGDGYALQALKIQIYPK